MCQCESVRGEPQPKCWTENTVQVSYLTILHAQKYNRKWWRAGATGFCIEFLSKGRILFFSSFFRFWERQSGFLGGPGWVGTGEGGREKKRRRQEVEMRALTRQHRLRKGERAREQSVSQKLKKRKRINHLLAIPSIGTQEAYVDNRKFGDS